MKSIGILYALAAAALFGASTPLSKVLVGQVPPVLLAGLLYFGSGVGLWLVRLARGCGSQDAGEAAIPRAQWPWLAGTDVIPLGGRSQSQVLQLAASLEAHSEHPVASAIVARWTGDAAQPDSSPKGAPSGLIQLGAVGSATAGAMLFVLGFESLTGRGVSGTMGGRKYLLGNRGLARQSGAADAQLEAHIDRLEGEGKTCAVLTAGSQALGILAVADTLRPTSAQAVRELHDLGVRAVMLSGDNATTVRAIAAEVGISDARGDLLPEDKLAALQVLAREQEPLGGAVGMVGDGINDAPALAQANVGFAMGAAGSDTASDTKGFGLVGVWKSLPLDGHGILRNFAPTKPKPLV